MHILKSIHVTAFQIFTNGRYSSMHLVSLSLPPPPHTPILPRTHIHDTSPQGIGHYLFAWERGRRILVV